MTLIEQKQVNGLVTDLANKSTADKTETLTNKDFDANGTGNSITNIEVADLAAGAVVTEAEGINANDNDTTLPTSAAVKDLVDTTVSSAKSYIGGYDANTNTPDLDVSPSATIEIGDQYTVTAVGAFFTITVEIGDVLISEKDAPTLEADWTIVQKNMDAASIKASYESNADTNAYTDAEVTKVSNLSGTNTGDQTSIVGITGTKAQFDTAVTDGDFMYIGDAPTAHTHLLAEGATDVTATPAEVNLLDLAGLTAGHVLSADTATTASWKAQTGTTVSVIEEDDACPVTVASTNFNITLGTAPTGGIAGITSVCINGVSVSAAELISVTTTTMVLNVPYAVDAADTVTTRYF